MQNYQSLFTPLQAGPTTLPNRLFFPPWCFNWANDDGTVSKKLFEFYTSLADSGCGMVTTGAAAVSPDSLLYKRAMKIYSKDHVPGLKKLAQALLQRNCMPAIQLMNFGRQSVTTFTGEPVYAPSAIPCPVKSKKDPNYKIREMTYEDIERVKNDFVNAAVLAVECGFKVVQVHAAHGFLLNEFLSPYSNYRSDEYGGSAINRARIIIEIIKNIKIGIGNEAAIDIRISADEFVDNGLKPDDYKEIIPWFEEAGVDMINVSSSVSESSGIMFRKPKEPQGRYAYLAKHIKEYTTKPIAYAGFVADFEHAVSIMQNNNIDMIGIGRAQVADPYLVQKYVQGKEDQINKCRYDNICLFSFAGLEDDQVYCTVNKNYKRPKNS